MVAQRNKREAKRCHALYRFLQRSWSICRRQSLRIPCPQIIRDWLNIYTWKETWMAFGIAGFMVSAWIYICIAIQLPNPWRSIMMWGYIAVMGLLAQHYNPQGRA